MTRAEDAAAVLHAAWQGRRKVAPLGPLAPADEPAAYAVQQALAEAAGAMPPGGFKVGGRPRRYRLISASPPQRRGS